MGSKTILLATDLSCRSDRALDRAAELASKWKAVLRVVHALQAHSHENDLPSWRRPPDPKTIAKERILADLLGTESVSIEVVVDRGDPATVILESADKHPCDLIVTGVARNEALGRFALGNTVERLIRSTETPVLLVKSRVHGPFRRVVVATDFSEGSRRALESALGMFPEARVTLFHSFDIYYGTLVDDKGAALRDAEKHALAEARAFLAATPAVADSGLAIDIVCEYGPAGPLLREYAQVHKIDMVVVGTQGRRGIAKFLLGSTAEKIISAVPVDVLVAGRRGN